MTAPPGYVLFRIGERRLAAPLDDVREIVRLGTLDRLPGTRAPFAGVTLLRGMPLPVVDVRELPDAATGDVLVVSFDGDDVVGVAVDAVTAVLAPEDLVATEARARSLPAYVVEVRRHRDAPVLVVDLRTLLDVAAPV